MRYLLNMWSLKLAGCQHGNIAFSTRDRIFESPGGWIFGSNNGAQTTWVCELCPAPHTPFFPQPQGWPLRPREGSYSWLYFSGGNTTHLWECKGVPQNHSLLENDLKNVLSPYQRKQVITHIYLTQSFSLSSRIYIVKWAILKRHLWPIFPHILTHNLKAHRSLLFRIYC